MRDLRAVARTATQATILRLTAGYSEDGQTAFWALDREGGFRLSEPGLAQSLLLAASLPDDDFDAFRVATAILLADRLQNGLIEDNLFWYWDAFQDHYTLMPAWQRAAIMNGYAQAHRDNLVDLFDPPSAEVRQSHDRDAVERAFAEAAPEAVPPGCAAGAVLLGDPELGNALWSLFATQGGPQPLTGMALRHIYETNAAFDPLPGQWFDAMGESPPPIPRADRD